MTPLSSITDHCMQYANRKWALIPVPYKSKNPGRKEWQRERYTPDDIDQLFGGAPSNVGVILGRPSCGLVDVDLDHPVAISLARSFIPPTEQVFGRPSKRYSHWLYKADPLPEKTTQFHDPVDHASLLELRGGATGGAVQTIFPPSVRGAEDSSENDEIIQWECFAEASPIDGDELLGQCKVLAAATLIAKHYPAKGSRHNFTNALAGGLLRGGRDEAWVEHFIEAVASAAGDEEALARLKNVDSTARRIAEDAPATGWPAVAQYLELKVMDKLGEWLNIKQAAHELARAGIATTQQSPEAGFGMPGTPGPTAAVNRSWPAPPGDVVYRGLAGKFVELSSLCAEGDHVGMLGSFLTMFGNCLGRGPHSMVGATRHDPRLFVVLVGKSAKSRKDSSQEPAKVILASAEPDGAKHRIWSGLSSGEGLIHAVRDPVFTKKMDKKTGVVSEIVTDEGEPDKRLLVQEGELARVLQVMRREGNTLSALIRLAWDGRDLQTMTRTNPLRATEPYISMIGSVTIEELRRELTDTSIANGFANRFLWLCVRRAKLLPDPPIFEGADVDALAAEVRRAVAKARNINRMTRTPEATEMWKALYNELSQEIEDTGLVGSLTARAEAQIVRLSMIYALLDETSEINPYHIMAATELWAYAERSCEYIYGNTTGDECADTILQQLRLYERLSRTEISRLFANHLPTKQIDMALDVLQGRGVVRSYSIKSGGRPVEYWELTQ